jgi:hypothetical protein
MHIVCIEKLKVSTNSRCILEEESYAIKFLHVLKLLVLLISIPILIEEGMGDCVHSSQDDTWIGCNDHTEGALIKEVRFEFTDGTPVSHYLSNWDSINYVVTLGNVVGDIEGWLTINPPKNDPKNHDPENPSEEIILFDEPIKSQNKEMTFKVDLRKFDSLQRECRGSRIPRPSGRGGSEPSPGFHVS